MVIRQILPEYVLLGSGWLAFLSGLEPSIPHLATARHCYPALFKFTWLPSPYASPGTEECLECQVTQLKPLHPLFSVSSGGHSWDCAWPFHLCLSGYLHSCFTPLGPVPAQCSNFLHLTIVPSCLHWFHMLHFNCFQSSCLLMIMFFLTQTPLEGHCKPARAPGDTVHTMFFQNGNPWNFADIFHFPIHQHFKAMVSMDQLGRT